MSTKTENILLTLAYLLFADKHHLHRLHFVGESIDTAEDWITGARDAGPIEELRWSLTEERENRVLGVRRNQTILS
jgi:predicted deacetylase